MQLRLERRLFALGEKTVVLMMQEDHQSTNYLENSSFHQPVTVLSGDCTSMDGSFDSVHCRATKESSSLCDSVDCDLMITHPNIASRLEKMETLTSRISAVYCKTKRSLSHNDDDAVDPVLCWELLDELQKARL